MSSHKWIYRCHKCFPRAYCRLKTKKYNPQKHKQKWSDQNCAIMKKNLRNLDDSFSKSKSHNRTHILTSFQKKENKFFKFERSPSVSGSVTFCSSVASRKYFVHSNRAMLAKPINSISRSCAGYIRRFIPGQTLSGKQNLRIIWAQQFQINMNLISYISKTKDYSELGYKNLLKK